jgi:hypothetical protein
MFGVFKDVIAVLCCNLCDCSMLDQMAGTVAYGSHLMTVSQISKVSVHQDLLDEFEW